MQYRWHVPITTLVKQKQVALKYFYFIGTSIKGKIAFIIYNFSHYFCKQLNLDMDLGRADLYIYDH